MLRSNTHAAMDTHVIVEIASLKKKTVAKLTSLAALPVSDIHLLAMTFTPRLPPPGLRGLPNAAEVDVDSETA